jgi:hypothetical protein
MNEFTKEELKDLKKCVYFYDDLRYDGPHAELIVTLQNMIDNYCLHARS